MIAPVKPASKPEHESFTATRNACKLCAPLGACLAFRGVEGAIPFLHGSQGCATYIRRYMISHFKEPLDIASSNFSETTAIFGGLENLRIGLANVVRQYRPGLIGLATTCLAETIGDDVKSYLRQIRGETPDMPPVVHVSTPSYRGTHAEGFHAAIRALVDALSEGGPRQETVNLLPGIVSPADLRYLKAILRDFGLDPIMLADYSDTLDGPVWTDYQQIPAGGTPIDAIRAMGRSRATLELGLGENCGATAGMLLEERFGVARHLLPLPMGVIQTDRLFEMLETLSGRPTPPQHADERGRLVDSYVDAHKYIFGKRAVVYGESDLVVGLASLLAEIGITPVLCATGETGGHLHDRIAALEPELVRDVTVCEGIDFAEIETQVTDLKPDLVVGSSKGYRMARKAQVPLVRVGFPIHDRIDGPRLLHVGYRGAQQLFDRIVNAVMEAAQDESPVAYSYM